MMMENGITPVYNIDGNGNNSAWGDGGWIWIIFLFFLMAWGGGWNHMGDSGSGFNSAGFQGYATRADVNEGFLFNNVQSGIQNLATQMCNNTASINSNLANGFAGVNLGMNTAANSIQAQLAQNGYQTQQCCCETKEAIQNVNYNLATQAANIVAAGNANTQRILDMITSDKIDSLRTDLTSAQLQLNNEAQTNALITALRPTPIPAYITCSPYSSYGSSGTGCGCTGYSY